LVTFCAQDSYLPTFLPVEYDTALPCPLEFTVTDLDRVEKRYRLISRTPHGSEPKVEVVGPLAITLIDAVEAFKLAKLPVSASGSLLYRRVDSNAVSIYLGCNIDPWLKTLAAAGVVTQGVDPRVACENNSFDSNSRSILNHLIEKIDGLGGMLTFTWLQSGSTGNIIGFRDPARPRRFNDVVLALVRPAPEILIAQLAYPGDGYVWPLKYNDRKASEFPVETSGLGKKYRLAGTIEGDVKSQWVHLSKVEAGNRRWYSTYSGEQTPLPDDKVIDAMTQFVIYYAVGDAADDLPANILAARLDLKVAISEMNQSLRETADKSDKGVRSAHRLLVKASRQIAYHFANPEAKLSSYPEQELSKLRSMEAEVGNVELALKHISETQARRSSDQLSPMTFLNLDGSCFLQVVTQILFSLPDAYRLIESIPDKDVQAIETCKANHGGNICRNQNPFKSALRNLFGLKAGGAAIAYVTELRFALGGVALFTDGWSPIMVLKLVREKIPGLLKESEVYEYVPRSAVQARIKEQTISRTPTVLFIILASGAGSDIPLNALSGNGSEYDMIGTIEETPGHTWTHTRVNKPGVGQFQWYDLNNELATQINAGRVVDSETTVLVYRLVNAGDEICKPANLGKAFEFSGHSETHRLFSSDKCCFESIESRALVCLSTGELRDAKPRPADPTLSLTGKAIREMERLIAKCWAGKRVSLIFADGHTESVLVKPTQEELFCNEFYLGKTDTPDLQIVDILSEDQIAAAKAKAAETARKASTAVAKAAADAEAAKEAAAAAAEAKAAEAATKAAADAEAVDESTASKADDIKYRSNARQGSPTLLWILIAVAAVTLAAVGVFFYFRV